MDYQLHEQWVSHWLHDMVTGEVVGTSFGSNPYSAIHDAILLLQYKVISGRIPQPLFVDATRQLLITQDASDPDLWLMNFGLLDKLRSTNSRALDDYFNNLFEYNSLVCDEPSSKVSSLHNFFTLDDFSHYFVTVLRDFALFIDANNVQPSVKSMIRFFARWLRHYSLSCYVGNFENTAGLLAAAKIQLELPRNTKSSPGTRVLLNVLFQLFAAIGQYLTVSDQRQMMAPGIRVNGYCFVEVTAAMYSAAAKNFSTRQLVGELDRKLSTKFRELICAKNP